MTRGHFSRSLKNFAVWLRSLYQTEHLCNGFMAKEFFIMTSKSLFKVIQEFFSLALIALPDWTLVHWVHGATKRTAERPWEIFKVIFQGHSKIIQFGSDCSTRLNTCALGSWGFREDSWTPLRNLLNSSEELEPWKIDERAFWVFRVHTGMNE